MIYNLHTEAEQGGFTARELDPGEQAWVRQSFDQGIETADTGILDQRLGGDPECGGLIDGPGLSPHRNRCL